MSEPRFNTIPLDKEIFQKERLVFVDHSARFKFGRPNFGLSAINSLESMYKALIYSTHHENDSEEAIQFTSDIRAVRDKIIKYASSQKTVQNFDNKGVANASFFARDPEYIRLSNDLETLYERMLIYKKQVGMG